MPEDKFGSDPDLLPVLWSSPPKVWETGESPDQSRVPGTRRLWAAGALAVVVLIGSVTALALQEPRTGNDTENAARERTGRTTTADDPIVPTVVAAAPDGKSGLSSPQPTASKSSKSSDSQQGGSKTEPEPEPSKSETESGTSGKKPPSSSKPSTSSGKSVQAVNYPDRYWRVSGGAVRLDAPRGSDARDDSTFDVVKGLANSSCYSFRTADGKYLRHRNFVLRADRNDGSGLFSKDATFCPGRSPFPGAVMLQSVNYPNYALRHRNFELRLDPYGYNTGDRQDFSFRLVEGVG